VTPYGNESVPDEETRCWYMIAYPERRCAQIARWHLPTAFHDFTRRSRWCDEHRHDNDIPIVAAAKGKP